MKKFFAWLFKGVECAVCGERTGYYTPGVICDTCHYVALIREQQEIERLKKLIQELKI